MSSQKAGNRAKTTTHVSPYSTPSIDTCLRVIDRRDCFRLKQEQRFGANHFIEGNYRM